MWKNEMRNIAVTGCPRSHSWNISDRSILIWWFQQKAYLIFILI